jgi:hypothetical protein
MRPLHLGAVALVLALGPAVSGCGGSDEDAVRATLARLERATAKHDYATVCQKVLSKRLVASVTRVGLPCEQAVGLGLRQVKDPEVRVGKVTVDGDHARAQVRSGAAGQASSDDVVDLVKEDGGWRVTSLGGGGGPPGPAREAP